MKHRNVPFDPIRLQSILDVKLYPLLVIASQRWKIDYHPDGDKNTKIEYASDVGHGIDITGYEWDIYQAELELKKGDLSVLTREESYLREHFNFLKVESHSKPTPGFENLSSIITSSKAQNFIHDQFKDSNKFRVLKNMPSMLKS